MAIPPAVEQNPDIRFLGRLLGDVIRAYGGERAVPADRIYPRGLGRPASRRRRPATRSIPASTRWRSTTRSPSCAASCCSRCSPTSPRIGRASPPSRAPTSPTRSSGCEAQGIGRDAVAELLEQRADRAGAHRPSDRGAAQEHDRPSQPHRRADAAARRRPRRDAGGRAGRGGDRSARSPCSGRPGRCAASGSTSPTRSRPRCAYLRDVFLPVLPALYARWERALGMRPPSFLRPGSWIGGDRDGNPFVTADSLRARARPRGARRCSATISTQLHALGAELSISSELRRGRRRRSQALAEASGDDSAGARATSPIAARSPASMRGSPPPIRR